MSQPGSTPGPSTPRARTRRLEAALAAVDAANGDDPHSLEVRGEFRPKELAHAELVTEWVRRLRPEPSHALLLAARAHHVRRWEIPRERYPKDRAGYLRWRKELQKFHSNVAAEILRGVGYDDATVTRVQDILRKRDLRRDPEVQAFEDALCLTFLETQLAAFADEHPSEKARTVLVKTLAKMSSAGRRVARELPLSGSARVLLGEALESVEH